MTFSDQITQWYKLNKRDLPWRKTTQAYFIWLSEIMLQQTRVQQGLPYYLAFVEAFPTVDALANASEDHVLKLWQGLGYYSRARNLHATAKHVAHQLNGEFPSSKAELMKLKGVGDYTASAIASFAFNEAVAVVDGNVNRVLARYFGIDLPINERAGELVIREKANLVLNPQQPALHNQAIMEFGALQCTPKSPPCTSCPLHSNCVAFQQGRVSQLPIKLKKTKVQTRYLAYFVFVDEAQQTLIQQRKGKGIWENLYEFPVAEFTTKPTKKAIQVFLEKHCITEIHSFKRANQTPIVHLLSHRKLIADFYIVKTPQTKTLQDDKAQQIVAIQQLNEYAVPVLIANFINTYLL